MIQHLEQTRKHVQRVQHFMVAFAHELLRRAIVHDESKFGPEEAPFFAAALPGLSKTPYGTPQYKEMLDSIRPAIDHHQANNSHHPEFYGGIQGMCLLDLVEMFCDWKAASERSPDGDIRKSLVINMDRFKIAPQLIRIMNNTVPFVEAKA